MGLRNVAAFIMHSGGLSNPTFRVGLYMALHSMDPGRDCQPQMAGRYAQGWQFIAQVTWPDRDPANARKAFQRGVKELQEAGFIVAERHAHSGQTQAYRFTHVGMRINT